MFHRTSFFVTLLIAATGSTARADDVRWGVGLGLEYGPDFPAADASGVSPSPMIERLEGGEVFYADLQGGPRIGLHEAGPVEFGLAVDFREGRDRDDLPHSLRGLDEIDLAIELGAYAAWTLDPFQLRIDVVTDVADAHGGTVITPALEWYSDSDADLRLNIGIGVDWTDRDYQRTYFGVGAAEALATGLPAYDPDAGISRAFVQAGVAYDLSADWALSTVIGWSRWRGDAGKSPVTRLGDERFATAEIGVIRFW